MKKLIILLTVILFGCVTAGNSPVRGESKTSQNYISRQANWLFAVDSVPGISDQDLVKSCQEGCAATASSGSQEYNSCVYCCTHSCKKN